MHGRKNYIDATGCDANWIRLQWDLTRDTIRRAEIRLGTDWHTAVPVLRVFEVAADDVNSVSEVRVKDVLIEAGVNTCMSMCRRNPEPTGCTLLPDAGGTLFCSRQVKCLCNAGTQCEGCWSGERQSRGQWAFDRKEIRDPMAQSQTAAWVGRLGFPACLISDRRRPKSASGEFSFNSKPNWSARRNASWFHADCQGEPVECVMTARSQFASITEVARWVAVLRRCLRVAANAA